MYNFCIYLQKLHKYIIKIIIIIIIISITKDLLSKITNLPLKPQTKIKLLKMVVYPKLSFELKIYDFSYTWIANELDSLVRYHIRKWIQLPVSCCIPEFVGLPKNKCGLNIESLREYANPPEPQFR